MRHVHPPRVPFLPFSSRGRLKLPGTHAKAVTAMVATAGLVATVAITPASAASAATLRPHPRPPAMHHGSSTPRQLPKLPRDLPREHGVPVIPPQAPKPRLPHPHALPKPLKDIGSYPVSEAVLAFLHLGLGLPVTGSTVLTGMRTGHTITVTTAAGPKLDFGLPRGIAAPSFSRARLVIDPAADTVAVTAVAADATVSTPTRCPRAACWLPRASLLARRGPT